MRTSILFLTTASTAVSAVTVAERNYLHHPGHAPSGMTPLKRVVIPPKEKVEPVSEIELKSIKPVREHIEPSSILETENKSEKNDIHQKKPLKRLVFTQEQQKALRTYHQRNIFDFAKSLGSKVTSLAEESISKKVDEYLTNKNTNAVTRLQNLYNSQYVGAVGVGTVSNPPNCLQTAPGPVQFIASDFVKDKEECHFEEQTTINVVFDSGSTNLWIASDLCTTEPCVNSDRHRYAHSISETYKAIPDAQNLDIEFGTGELRGTQGIDDFHVGPFTVKHQTFGMIAEEVGEAFHTIPFEGILGLAFPSMSANNVAPFFDNVIDQKVLKMNEFAFYFNMDEAAKVNETPRNNAIFWGGVDPAFYEKPIKMFPVTQKHYWALDLHEFKVGNTIYDVDTGEEIGTATNNYLSKNDTDTSSGDSTDNSLADLDHEVDVDSFAQKNQESLAQNDATNNSEGEVIDNIDMDSDLKILNNGDRANVIDNSNSNDHDTFFPSSFAEKNSKNPKLVRQEALSAQSLLEEKSRLTKKHVEKQIDSFGYPKDLNEITILDDGKFDDIPAPNSMMQVKEKKGEDVAGNGIPKLIVDTGTTYFTAGKQLYHKLLERLPSIDCDKIKEEDYPPLIYVLKNANGDREELLIPQEIYMVTDASGKCDLAFMNIDLPSGYGPGMLLGEVFMRHYFTVFQREASTHSAGDEEPEEEDDSEHGKELTPAQKLFKAENKMRKQKTSFIGFNSLPNKSGLEINSI